MYCYLNFCSIHGESNIYSHRIVFQLDLFGARYVSFVDTRKGAGWKEEAVDSY